MRLQVEDFPIPIIKKISEKMGMDEPISYLGQGTFGLAYSCGNKVIKITTDRDEANLANILRKMPITTYFVNYYDCRPLSYSKYKKYDLFVNVLDKVFELPKEIKDVVLYDLDDNYTTFIELLDLYLESQKLGVSKLKEVLSNDNNQYALQTTKNLLKIFKSFPEIYKEYQTIKSKVMLDIHPGNLGISNDGNLQIFDQMGNDKISHQKLNKGIIV